MSESLNDDEFGEFNEYTWDAIGNLEVGNEPVEDDGVGAKPDGCGIPDSHAVQDDDGWFECLASDPLPEPSKSQQPSVSYPLPQAGQSQTAAKNYNTYNGGCPHGRQRSKCKECGGSEICQHQKLRNMCKDCRGRNICDHGRQRAFCRDCGGTGICTHGRHKLFCKDCKGSQICGHGRQKAICKDCKGSQICDHGRQRSICKDCKGSQICDHGRIKSSCKDCKGSQICDHGRLRARCKDCGGSQICTHGKIKYGCRQCRKAREEGSSTQAYHGSFALAILQLPKITPMNMKGFEFQGIQAYGGGFALAEHAGREQEPQVPQTIPLNMKGFELQDIPLGEGMNGNALSLLQERGDFIQTKYGIFFGEYDRYSQKEAPP